MSRYYPTPYSIVGHSFLEQLCRVEVKRARTKDLVWLVYRNTLGRFEGLDTGAGWKASGTDIAAALGIQRANAQRCRAEAIELGLISVGPSGEMFVGIARTIHRNPVLEVDPVGSSLYPVGSSLYPVGSKKRGGLASNKQRRKKNKAVSRSVREESSRHSADHSSLSFDGDTLTDQDVNAELIRLIKLEESTDRETAARARDERERILNLLGSIS